MMGQGRTVAAGLLPDPSTQAKLSQHFEPRLHLLHKIVGNVGGGSENRPLLSGSRAADRILDVVDHRTRQPLQRSPFHAQFSRKRLKRIDVDRIDITYASDRDRHVSTETRIARRRYKVVSAGEGNEGVATVRVREKPDGVVFEVPIAVSDEVGKQQDAAEFRKIASRLEAMLFQRGIASGRVR